MNKSIKNRRLFVKRASALLAAFGLGTTSAHAAVPKPTHGKSALGTVVKHDDVPLFSSAVAHGNLLFLAGKGAHFEGDIKAHTEHVLNELEKELKKAGSSMEKVVKVNVYLHDLEDYTAMNEVYRGRFGDSPPVRTTVSCYGGIPGNSLVEIDCIATLN
jgi:2-iminobutanoate/2-iminopropanoate deaminase